MPKSFWRASTARRLPITRLVSRRRFLPLPPGWEAQPNHLGGHNYVLDKGDNTGAKVAQTSWGYHAESPHPALDNPFADAPNQMFDSPEEAISWAHEHSRDGTDEEDQPAEQKPTEAAEPSVDTHGFQQNPFEGDNTHEKTVNGYKSQVYQHGGKWKTMFEGPGGAGYEAKDHPGQQEAFDHAQSKLDAVTSGAKKPALPTGWKTVAGDTGDQYHMGNVGAGHFGNVKPDTTHPGKYMFYATDSDGNETFGHNATAKDAIAKVHEHLTGAKPDESSASSDAATPGDINAAVAGHNAHPNAKKALLDAASAGMTKDHLNSVVAQAVENKQAAGHNKLLPSHVKAALNADYGGNISQPGANAGPGAASMPAQTTPSSTPKTSKAGATPAPGSQVCDHWQRQERAIGYPADKHDCQRSDRRAVGQG